MRYQPFFAGLLGLVLATSTSPAIAGFTIVPDFKTDPSWANAPAFATAAVNIAIGELETLYSNNVTIKIVFGWGDVNGQGLVDKMGNPINGAAASPSFSLDPNNGYTLQQTEAFLALHAAAHPENAPINTAVPHLPLAYPNPNGSSNFFVSNAEKEALTAVPGPPLNSGGIDGYVGFGTKSTAGDMLGFAEHEISHVMGRVDYAFVNLTQPGMNPPFLTPLDFYKYTSNTIGTANPQLNPTDTITAFSIDGGATNPGGYQFNANSDSADWQGQFNDSFAAFQNNGASMTNIDFTEMQALGWDPAAPEPSTCLLFGASLTAMALQVRRKNRRPRTSLPVG